MKAKTTKRALLMSALSLLLCISMLVGTTFAWFTDSVQSGINQIVAGNLDVELIHTNKADTDETVGATTKLFDDVTLWEPGAMAWEQLTVKNVGSLALKYNLSINFDNAVATPAGKTLADVLQIAVLDETPTRENIKGAALQPLKSFALQSNGVIEANAAPDTFFVAIYWAPSANDNDYNMNNGETTVLTIDLGVKLIATQATVEEDSFDETYDAGAWDFWDGASIDTAWYNPTASEFVLDSAADLAGFAAIVNGTANTNSRAVVKDTFQNKTVKLACDVDLMGNVWTPIGISSGNGFYGTFDGQGHTVRNYTLTTSSGNYGAGFFGNILGGAAIKNVTFDSVRYTKRSNVVSAVAAYLYGSATFENVHVTNADIQSFGKVGGILGMAADPGAHTVTMTDCSVQGNIGGGYNVGGLIGLALQGVTVNLNNCTTDVAFTLNDGGYNKAYAKNNNGEWMWLYGDSAHYAAVGEFYCYYDAQENERCEGDVKNVNLVAATGNQLSAALKTGEDVQISAGTYAAFPGNNAQNGQTITCAEGTVFEGTSSLNVNGATVIGGTFTDDTTAVSGTIDGTFKDCIFEGSEALRWCYTTAGETTVFENCVIKTDFRGFHFDDMQGNVIFKNCVIAGFNAYGGDGTVTFEGCTFVNDQSKYNGLNIYSTTNLIDCKFEFKSGKTNFIDMEGIGKTLTIDNCTAKLDGVEEDIAKFVGGSKLAQNTVIYK